MQSVAKGQNGMTEKHLYVYILPWTFAAIQMLVAGLNKPTCISCIFLLVFLLCYVKC